VVEEDDFAADLGLEPPGGHELGVEKPTREKTTGLLAEADDGGGHEKDGNPLITRIGANEQTK
jgi:hypothetical protein